jgi:hypothetical protein
VSFFYRCRSCLQTFPAFREEVKTCPLCSSPQIEEAPEMGMGERLERGAIYNVDLTNGQITKQSSPPFRGGGYLALDAKR